MNIIAKVIQSIFLLVIKSYQYFVSPFLPPSCRFTPTCSDYAKQCIIKFGPLKGSYFTIKRLLKCHPFGKKGYDPIPGGPKKVKNKENYGPTTTKL